MTTVVHRDPPDAGDGTLLVRCLVAAHRDLARLGRLNPLEADAAEVLRSAAGWWHQAADLAQAAGDVDQALTLRVRGRVLGLRADPAWDADAQAWLLDELERLLTFEEQVGVAMNQSSGSGALLDVVGAVLVLHQQRQAGLAELTEEVTDAGSG
jgi:hypothetical protein